MDSLRTCFINPLNVQITKRSTLILRGKGTIIIDSLNLDGALHLEAGEGVTIKVKNKVVKNDSYEFVSIYDPIESPWWITDVGCKEVPEILSIRGYFLKKNACEKFICTVPGVYEI